MHGSNQAIQTIINLSLIFQIIECDGAGAVVKVGPDCTRFKTGDEVFFIGLPTRQGTYSEYQLVPDGTVAHKPKSLDFVEAEVLPLTHGTTYEALLERLEIKQGENVGLLIIKVAVV
jgi:NADPH:quinone reductase-like Zn-dependent oxidoreductase